MSSYRITFWTDCFHIRYVEAPHMADAILQVLDGMGPEEKVMLDDEFNCVEVVNVRESDD